MKSIHISGERTMAILSFLLKTYYQNSRSENLWKKGLFFHFFFAKQKTKNSRIAKGGKDFSSTKLFVTVIVIIDEKETSFVKQFDFQ